jgi:hypothetical protein
LQGPFVATEPYYLAWSAVPNITFASIADLLLQSASSNGNSNNNNNNTQLVDSLLNLYQIKNNNNTSNSLSSPSSSIFPSTYLYSPFCDPLSSSSSSSSCASYSSIPYLQHPSLSSNELLPLSLSVLLLDFFYQPVSMDSLFGSSVTLIVDTAFGESSAVSLLGSLQTSFGYLGFTTFPVSSFGVSFRPNATASIRVCSFFSCLALVAVLSSHILSPSLFMLFSSTGPSNHS